LDLFVAASVSNIQICLEEAKSLMYHGIKDCMIPMYLWLLGDLDLNGVHNSVSSYRYSMFICYCTNLWSYLKKVNSKAMLHLNLLIWRSILSHPR